MLFGELLLTFPVRHQYIVQSNCQDFNDQTAEGIGGVLWWEQAHVIYLCNFGGLYTGRRQGLKQNQVQGE